MKEFNKPQELRKIKFKQNKNTYIKRISIILSCVILLVGIIMFTFAKFESNKSYTLIQGKLGDYTSGDITLSYVVDGVSQSVPPQKGSGYTLKNYSCSNSDAYWDKKEWEIRIKNMTGKVKCNLEFETATEVEVTLYGGVNEVVTIDDEIEYTMDSTGKKEGVIISTGEHELKGSISNQTFTVDVDSEDSKVYAMPNNGDGVIYWYGNILYDLTYNVNVKITSSYPKQTFLPTLNSNSMNFTLGSPDYKIYTMAFRTTSIIDSTKYSNAHFIGQFMGNNFNYSVLVEDNSYLVFGIYTCTGGSLKLGNTNDGYFDSVTDDNGIIVTRSDRTLNASLYELYLD